MVPLVHLELKGMQDQLGLKVHWALKERLAQPVMLVHRVLLAVWELLVLRVLWVNQDLRELLEVPVRLDLQDHQVRRDL